MLRYLLALGAGFMLAVTFLEILPKTIGLWTERSAGESALYVPMLLVLFGYLLTQFFEHTIAPHFHLGGDVHGHAEDRISARTHTAVAGLVIHTFLTVFL